jgi:hypothetical protein
MAVVTASFVKRGPVGNAKAKDTIRYIQHRPGKDHQRLTRELFGSDGPMERREAYQFIDDAPKRTVFFTIIISPDPATEDRPRDLDLEALTERTMLTLEERVRTPVIWAAAIHDDHTDKRHVHALAAVQGRLEKPDLKRLIEATTEACREQRLELDRALIREVGQREQQGWELEPELEVDAWGW